MGEGATAVPRVNLTVKRRNGELLALPRVPGEGEDGAEDGVDRAQFVVHARGVESDGVWPVYAVYALNAGASRPTRTCV